MKVALFIRNGLVGNVVLNALVPQMIEIGIEPVLYNTGEPYYKKADNPELKEIGYLETTLLKEIVEPLLMGIQDVSNEDSAEICYTNKQLAKKYGLSYFEVPDVNSPDFIEEIENDKDLNGSISIRITQIFKENIINSIGSKGFMWNLHTGLLPKYKGVHIPYRAIENNESDYGWTLHNIDGGVDTGTIIATDKLPLDPNHTILDTYLGMSEKGTAMMMGALLFFKNRGNIRAKSQETDKESYFTYPSNAEMQKWNNQGIKFSENIVDTYCNLFATRGSVEEQNLREALDAATRNLDKGIIYKAA